MVACNKVLPFSDPDDDRTAFPDRDNQPRMPIRHHSDAVRSLELVEHCRRRRQQIPVIGFRDQMGDHLAVGLRTENTSFGCQVTAQFLMVFDDAVVNYRDLTVIAEMGMCVDCRRNSVSRPAGVADAASAHTDCQAPVKPQPPLRASEPFPPLSLHGVPRRKRLQAPLSHSRDIPAAATRQPALPLRNDYPYSRLSRTS